jgi:formate dehydrogenase iron-sulfur subunit
VTRVFVPRDAAALALGADGVAAALAGHAVIVCTGSRGLFRLEPMVEVETPEGRIAYGPVTARDVPELLAAGMLARRRTWLRLGKPEEMPFLARQTRFTFARCGVTDPLSPDGYRELGGLKGLRRALESARPASSRK